MRLTKEMAGHEDEAVMSTDVVHPHPRPHSTAESASFWLGPSLREMTLPTFFSPNLSPRVQCLTLTPPSLLVSHGFDHLSGSGGFILSLPLPLSIQTRWEWRGQEKKPVAAVCHGFGKEHVLQSC